MLLFLHILQNKPDFVLLNEVNNSWAKELLTLEKVYPYSKMIPQYGNFGMAILSKSKLEITNVFVDMQNLIPALFLKAESQIGTLNLILLHAHPPIGQYGTLLRDQYLDTISRRIAPLNGPILVCGDFNTTPWSLIFLKFLRNSGLLLEGNYIPYSTWPTSFSIAGLPIDHCITRSLSINKYSKGPYIGSDHWPLVIKASLK